MNFANLFLWLSLVYGFGVLAVFLFLLVRGIYFGFVILFSCGAIFNCPSRILFCLVRPGEDIFLELRPIMLSVASGMGLLAMPLFLGGFVSLAAFLVRNPDRLRGTREDMNDSQFLPGALIVLSLACFAASPAASFQST